MNGVLAEVLPLALAGSVSPLTATVGILILTSKDRALAKTAAYLLGNLAVLAAVGAASFTLFDHVAAKHSAPHSETDALIDLGIGLVLLYLVLRGALKRPDTDAAARPKWLSGFDTMGLGRAFLFGMGVLVMNASTLVVYIPAVRAIVNAHLPADQTAGLLALTAVIVLSWMLVPFLLALLMPRRSQAWLRALNAWIGRHSRAITLLLLFVFGAYFVVKGLGELV